MSAKIFRIIYDIIEWLGASGINFFELVKSSEFKSSKRSRIHRVGISEDEMFYSFGTRRGAQRTFVMVEASV